MVFSFKSPKNPLLGDGVAYRFVWGKRAYYLQCLAEVLGDHSSAQSVSLSEACASIKWVIYIHCAQQPSWEWMGRCPVDFQSCAFWNCESPGKLQKQKPELGIIPGNSSSCDSCTPIVSSTWLFPFGGGDPPQHGAFLKAAQAGSGCTQKSLCTSWLSFSVARLPNHSPKVD